MSVHEPPGGRQPESPPGGYTPPQDPWGGDGFDTGVASVPTDPIPQGYQYNEYNRPDMWSQPTVQHGQQLPWLAPAPRRGRAGVVLLAILAVLLIGGGGGYGAYYLATHRSTNPPTTQPTTPSTTTSSSQRAWAVDAVVVGDCIGVDDANTAHPRPFFANCDKGAYQVLAVNKGADVIQDDNGVLEGKEAQNTCATTTYTNYYLFDADGNDNDYVLCLSLLK
jgi:hypothetical protein